MHAAVITHLRCPVCRGALSLADRVIRCTAGHTFDVARQGYVDLTAGRSVHAGDSAEMVEARTALLSAGHFDVISAAVSDVTASARFVVDVGAGTGHYLSKALAPDAVGLAVDVSKAALRRAARIDPRIGAVRADVWQGLPIADGAADAVLNVFAPRSGGEFARVLRPGGVLAVVTPTPAHLAELVTALGLLAVDPDKSDRLAASLGRWFEPSSAEPLTAALELSRDDAKALVGMGPSAWHVDSTVLAARLADMPEPIRATLSVELGVWHPRTESAG